MTMPNKTIFDYQKTKGLDLGEGDRDELPIKLFHFQF